jgi:hypothetical protein
MPKNDPAGTIKTLNASEQIRSPVNSKRAVRLIKRVSELAGSLTFLDDIQEDLRQNGIQKAVAQRDTPKIFDWLLTAFSYQGISDRVARGYMRRHGNASWSSISASLRRSTLCPLLRSHWDFDGCRYDKASFSCSQPDGIHRCPLPRHRLRNGRLNQTAYGFYLFVRDIADGDLVGWIDDRLALPQEFEAGEAQQELIIGPLRYVYGVSDKILTMTLSGLLLGAADGRPAWFETGKSMIAIDSLVHAFLHRTGILDDCDANHAYGVNCYAKGGCADIIRTVAQQIDASAFSAQYPAVFPRFIQHAIWRYCAADGLDICNGNRIDDRTACQYSYCFLFDECSKKSMYS